MKGGYFLSVTTLIMLLVTSVVCAQVHPTSDDTIQKIVLLDGVHSRLMKGDPLLYEISSDKARFKFDENAVLPYLLQTGWQIVSLEINEKSRSDRLYGYAVLRRDQIGNH